MKRLFLLLIFLYSICFAWPQGFTSNGRDYKMNASRSSSSQIDLINYIEPQLSSTLKVDSVQAKIIIVSPNKNLQLSYNMGSEKGIVTGKEKTGEYKYELTHTFNSEERSCKMILSVSSSHGNKTSLLILKPGECYCGRFEVPLKFSYSNESSQNSVFPYDNKAKILFLSEIDDLSISFNDCMVVKDGVSTHNLPYVTSERIEDTDNKDWFQYNLIFDMADNATKTDSFKRPTMKVKSSFPEELSIQLPEGSQLTTKTIYKYRILQQLVETVIDTTEIVITQKDSTFAIILPTYSIGKSQFSYGIMVGFVKKVGAYLRVKWDLNKVSTSFGCLENGMMENSDVISWYTGNVKKNRWAVTCGYVQRLAKPLYFYIGGGYGERKLAWETMGGTYALVKPYSYKGIEAEVGALVRFGVFSLSAGVQTNSFKYMDVNISLGAVF